MSPKTLWIVYDHAGIIISNWNAHSENVSCRNVSQTEMVLNPPLLNHIPFKDIASSKYVFMELNAINCM